MYLKQTFQPVRGIAALLCAAAVLFASSCSGNPASATTVYADTKHSESITKEDIGRNRQGTGNSNPLFLPAG